MSDQESNSFEPRPFEDPNVPPGDDDFFTLNAWAGSIPPTGGDNSLAGVVDRADAAWEAAIAAGIEPPDSLPPSARRNHAYEARVESGRPAELFRRTTKPHYSEGQPAESPSDPRFALRGYDGEFALYESVRDADPAAGSTTDVWLAGELPELRAYLAQAGEYHERPSYGGEFDGVYTERIIVNNPYHLAERNKDLPAEPDHEGIAETLDELTRLATGTTNDPHLRRLMYETIGSALEVAAELAGMPNNPDGRIALNYLNLKKREQQLATATQEFDRLMADLDGQLLKQITGIEPLTEENWQQATAVMIRLAAHLPLHAELKGGLRLQLLDMLGHLFVTGYLKQTLLNGIDDPSACAVARVQLERQIESGFSLALTSYREKLHDYATRSSSL